MAVPLRVGSVFVPARTWTSVGDRSVDEGEYNALRDRWRAVKDKLKKTDRVYREKVRNDPEVRDCLRSQGIRYIFPVSCTPRPEPIATDNPMYWLRSLSSDTFRSMQTGTYRAVPRVLTGNKPADFLK